MNIIPTNNEATLILPHHANLISVSKTELGWEIKYSTLPLGAGAEDVDDQA